MPGEADSMNPRFISNRSFSFNSLVEGATEVWCFETQISTSVTTTSFWVAITSEETYPISKRSYLSKDSDLTCMAKPCQCKVRS